MKMLPRGNKSSVKSLPSTERQLRALARLPTPPCRARRGRPPLRPSGKTRFGRAMSKRRCAL
jgi:hypothetical protein